MKEYVQLSIETHLFFARIMKEHALFLLAGFPADETQFRRRAGDFLKDFEEGLRSAVKLGNGMVRESVIDSGEIVTAFTLRAEQKTQSLIGVPIDIEVTKAEQRLRAGCPAMPDRGMVQRVRCLNRSMFQTLSGFIKFKEKILQEVLACRLYTSNYPLLIEHILREARMYAMIIRELEGRGGICRSDLRELELFWNQIMMEHAQFIRGLLDPTECALMETADGFAEEYCRLLEEARAKDGQMVYGLTGRSLETTRRYQAFKTAGTEGITGCRIRSVILPLLADHVLREANHYLRILEAAEEDNDGRRIEI